MTRAELYDAYAEEWRGFAARGHRPIYCLEQAARCADVAARERERERWPWWRRLFDWNL